MLYYTNTHTVKSLRRCDPHKKADEREKGHMCFRYIMNLKKRERRVRLFTPFLPTP